MTYIRLLVASTLLLTTPLTQAQGDIAQGRALFSTQCGFCHSTEAGKNLMGPSLHGVFDRASALAPGFTYSAALRGARLTWNNTNLDEWLTNPASLVPCNMMMFPGQTDTQSRQHIIAYLKSLK